MGLRLLFGDSRIVVKLYVLKLISRVTFLKNIEYTCIEKDYLCLLFKFHLL